MDRNPVVHEPSGKKNKKLFKVIGQEPYSIKTDVWSLGCIFYEMLFGKTPWYNDRVHQL
jgi:serine/threonine protein kinase